MSETATPDTGALSVDAAIASLLPPEQPVEQEQAQEAPAEAAEGQEEPQGEASSPEEAADGAETPDDGEQTTEEEAPVVAAEPPAYWSKDAKEAFAQLSPELQAVVLAQEGPREEAAAKAKAEAAETKRAAEAEMGKVKALADQLADFLPQALETFQSRWGQNPDWVGYANEYGAEAMAVAKVQYEAELAQLQKLSAAKQQAETQAYEAYVKAEAAKLAEIAPELADPEKGGERRQAVAQYLVKAGVDPDSIRHISAAEMSLAHKAMLWDEAQAKLKAAPKPAPKPAPKAAPVRPAAAQPGTPQQRTAQQIQHRFAQTRSVDDAVALLLARKG